MNIVIQYDSSVNSAPSGFKTAVQVAVNYFDKLILNPISVPILFSYGTIEGQALAQNALGESLTNGNIETYTQVASLLSAAAISRWDYQSLQALPASDPLNGGRVWVSDAQAKVFGLGGAGYTDPEDGFVALGSSATFTFDPNNRAVSGAYDAIGVFEHEISETLGRISYLGTGKFEGYSLYSTLDFFRYSGAGVHQFANAAGYFSVDGQNLLTAYNDPSNKADAGDWAASDGDAFDAYSLPGVQATISQSDRLEMELLGFQVNWGAHNDFNADGSSDLVWRHTDGDVSVWLANSGASYSGFTAQDLGIVPSHWSIANVADFNGDGKVDLLWRDANGDTGLWLSGSSSALNNFTKLDLGIVPGIWVIQGAADFNGDGKADILWRDIQTGDLELWGSNSGSAYSGFTGQDLGVVPMHWNVQQFADFNGDGKADLLWRDGNGDVGLWLSASGSGFAGFTRLDLGVTPSHWTVQASGDFGGAGKADILWRDSNGDVGLWLSNAGSGYTGFTKIDLGVVPNFWVIQGVGDFNGDGKADIVWRDTQTGDAGVWLSNHGSGYAGFTNHDLGVMTSDWHLI